MELPPVSCLGAEPMFPLLAFLLIIAMPLTSHIPVEPWFSHPKTEPEVVENATSRACRSVQPSQVYHHRRGRPDTTPPISWRALSDKRMYAYVLGHVMRQQFRFMAEVIKHTLAQFVVQTSKNSRQEYECYNTRVFYANSRAATPRPSPSGDQISYTKSSSQPGIRRPRTRQHYKGCHPIDPSALIFFSAFTRRRP